MLTLHFGSYNIGNLKFLVRSIQPDCKYYQAGRKCEHYKTRPYKVACNDLKNLEMLCVKTIYNLPSDNIRLKRMPNI